MAPRNVDATHLIVQHAYRLRERYPVSIFHSSRVSSVRLFVNQRTDTAYSFSQLILKDASQTILSEPGNVSANVTVSTLSYGGSNEYMIV